MSFMWYLTILLSEFLYLIFSVSVSVSMPLCVCACLCVCARTCMRVCVLLSSYFLWFAAFDWTFGDFQQLIYVDLSIGVSK
jgi:hypothetical protein